MIQNGEDGLDVLGFDGSALQVHGNDNFRAHLTHDVSRQIVQKSAIHENGFSIMNRRKSARNGHG